MNIQNQVYISIKGKDSPNKNQKITEVSWQNISDPFEASQLEPID